MEMFHTKAEGKNRNTHFMFMFMFKKHFFLNRAVYMIIMCRAGEATGDNTTPARCMLDT
jgi:hypothetical protein